MAHSSLSPMTVLLGVLVVAAYQNRVKLLDLLDNRGAKGAIAARPAVGSLGDGQAAPVATSSRPLHRPKAQAAGASSTSRAA